MKATLKLSALAALSTLSLVACGPQALPNPSAMPSESRLTNNQPSPAGRLGQKAIRFERPDSFRVQSQQTNPQVLMILPNQDFWYDDYALPRQALEAQGVQVTVAAASLATAYPHWGSGEGTDGGAVNPELRLAEVNPDDYDALLFVGGWGASAYQYGFSETYFNPAYNGSPETREQINHLIGSFVAQDKYLSAICHGVTVLAWARVNGASPLAGQAVTGWNGPAPDTQGQTVPSQARWHIESNGAQMLPSGAIGDPGTSHDDVLVSGKLITAEDARAGTHLGEVLANHLLADLTSTAPAQSEVTASPLPVTVPTPAPSPSVSPSATPEPQQAVLPVLLVIANQDFYYREYADPRDALLGAGIPVVVAAEQTLPSYPHPGTGQGDSSGEVLPDIRLDQAQAQDYAAIVFVGGWGASQYQYAFEGTYAHGAYNGNPATKAAVNQLINDFAAQDKYVMGICHGASVLAWARINGVSPLAGLPATGGPWLPELIGPGPMQTRDYLEANQAIYVPSRSIGDPSTSADDLVIAGRFITAEDYDTALLAGTTLAQLLQAN